MTDFALGGPLSPSLQDGLIALRAAAMSALGLNQPALARDLHTVARAQESAAAPRPARPGPGPFLVMGGGGPPDDDHDEPAGNGPGPVWAIVERAQRGDAEAFGQLYDQYVDLVFRYVHFRVGSRVQAEDLTSETFLRALRRLNSVSWQGRDFGAWLVTIARNLIADHYKSARYRLEISTADMLDADRAEDGPENSVLDAISSATLIDAVRKLNPVQQECVVLRFLQGMSVTEAAQAMGKNEGAIKALQYRAVRALGRLLPDGFVR